MSNVIIIVVFSYLKFKIKHILTFKITNESDRIIVSLVMNRLKKYNVIFVKNVGIV